MNLYIWGDEGNISYGCESLIVMAPNLREARKAAEKAMDWSYGSFHKKYGSQVRNDKPDKVIKNRACAAYFMCQE